MRTSCFAGVSCAVRRALRRASAPGRLRQTRAWRRVRRYRPRWMIEIEFATGTRLRISGAVDAVDHLAGDRGSEVMIPIPSGAWVATGHIHMRRVSRGWRCWCSKRNLHNGHLFVV
jgi:hypothetical protein